MHHPKKNLIVIISKSYHEYERLLYPYIELELIKGKWTNHKMNVRDRHGIFFVDKVEAFVENLFGGGRLASGMNVPSPLPPKDEGRMYAMNEKNH
jgi:hypothetical protein